MDVYSATVDPISTRNALASIDTTATPGWRSGHHPVVRITPE